MPQWKNSGKLFHRRATKRLIIAARPPQTRLSCPSSIVQYAKSNIEFALKPKQRET
jgi:hypothetical protein